MNSPKFPSYIVIKPAGIHFRIRVPLDIRALVGKKELRRSLTSLSRRSAQLEAHRLSIIAKSYFDTVRQNQKISPISATVELGQLPISHPETEQFSSADVSKSVSLTLSNMICAYSEEQVQTGNWAPKTEQENTAIYALFI